MGKALTEEMKQQIVNLWLNHNFSQQDAANYLGISYGTVNRIIKEYTADGSHEPPKDMPMPPEAIKQEAEPVLMTEEHFATIPEAVLSAVESKIADLRETIRSNAEQAESLLRHNDNHIKRIEILEKWLTEVRDDSTED